MRERRPYAPGRRPARRRQNDGQRNLLIGAGLFVVALMVVAALLLTGDDGEDEPQQDNLGSSLATATQGEPSVPLTTSPGATNTSVASVVTPGGTSQAVVATPTSASTLAPTLSPTTDSSSEPTEDTGEEDTADAGATEDTAETDGAGAADPEPTEAIDPEPEPEVEPEPLIGDFGQLPPAQIVSGGVSRSLDLAYELDASAVSAPQTALVYQLVWPERSVDEVQAIADSLGMDATVDDLGDGNYQAFGESAELYVSPQVIQYVSLDTASDGELEDDETLAGYARSWLSANGLVSTAPGAATVVGRDDDANIAIVFVKPADPSPMLAAYPSASITLTSGGAVQQANIQWPAGYTPSEYGMKSLNEVWNRVVAGEGAVEADLSGVSGSGTVSGSFIVDSVGVGYSLASGGSGDFLVPLMVFYGTGYADTGETFPMAVYVSAVQGEVSAAG